MSFNILSWKQEGRGFGRGSSPPRGSIEWITVGDMWQTENTSPSDSQCGAVYKIGFTELDAADRWITRLHDNIKYSRQTQGNKVLTNADVAKWDDFIARWNPFRNKLSSTIKSPLAFQMMLSDNKTTFDRFLNESKKIHDQFTAKGMTMVPVPYMGELIELLRSMPKQLTAGQMISKLEAGIKCGKKMLDENTSWFYWMISNDTNGLKRAIQEAQTQLDAYSPSRKSPMTYAAGDPAYDEFMRRLTKIWIEAAGLYGMSETRNTAAAEVIDDVRDRSSKTSGNLLWLLAAAGAAYLGISWIVTRQPKKISVGVPDAYPQE